MKQYIAYRHGSNAANQSMTPKMAVGLLDSPKVLRNHLKMETASAWAEEHGVTVYNNQWLELVPAASVSASEWHEANEAMRWIEDSEYVNAYV